jgi:hypothetical protein
VCPRYLSFDEHAAAAEGFFLRLEVGLRREVGCIVVQIGIEVVGLLEELSGGQRDELFERDAAGRVSVEQDMAQLLVRRLVTKGLHDLAQVLNGDVVAPARIGTFSQIFIRTIVQEGPLKRENEIVSEDVILRLKTPQIISI